MAQPTLLENLRKAHMGSYGVILSLLGCLDHGLHAKRLVDRVIDASKPSRSLFTSQLEAFEQPIMSQTFVKISSSTA
jgi:hypothetical protein